MDKEFTINVHNGFYVGDLCYALKDEYYYDMWGTRGCWKDNKYKDEETGEEFAMVGTYGGDGCFASNIPEDNEFGCEQFPVDAGNIGVADLSLCKDNKKDFEQIGHIVENYSGEVTISYESGNIRIIYGDEEIFIYTAPDYDEEDEWPDYEEDEEEY